MHIDSGTKCNVISEDTQRQINIKTALRKYDIKLKSFSGHTIKSKGTVTSKTLSMTYCSKLSEIKHPLFWEMKHTRKLD